MTEMTGSASAPAGRRVLVVDGNTDAAESLAVVLRLHGHDVTTARTATEALNVARSLSPDAVFLSIILHGMTGYEVARRLRAERVSGPPLLLIAMTGFARPEDRDLALAAGFDHYFVKPADPAAVLALLGTNPTPP
jgi:CheY-like chemotaxis protein